VQADTPRVKRAVDSMGELGAAAVTAAKASVNRDLAKAAIN
jgi:hypothetical protein